MLNSTPLTVAAACACALTGILTAPVFAGETDSPAKAVIETTNEKSWCERLWEYPTIYKNEDSGFLNEFRIVGRAHFDEYMIDADNANNWDQDWVVRRLRIGAKARFFHHLDAHVELDFNPQSQFVGSPAYQRLTDAYLAWTFSEAVKLTVGKQSAKFTLDGSTSSNELITIDRNNIANNLWFTTEYIPGVSLSGKVQNWVYNTGVFSGGTASKEFGNFDAGNFELVSLGYDFGKLLNIKRALVRADYVHNERNLESTFTRAFENVGSLVFQLDTDRFGFWGELTGGTGYGTQSDVWGVNVTPYYNLTKQIQAVFRYTYMNSVDPRGIRLNRYDNFVSGQRGDEYHEFYGGLNYYICGHRLKVQTGISYVSLDDTSIRNGEYHSWQWVSGLRLSF